MVRCVTRPGRRAKGRCEYDLSQSLHNQQDLRVLSSQDHGAACCEFSFLARRRKKESSSDAAPLLCPRRPAMKCDLK